MNIDASSTKSAGRPGRDLLFDANDLPRIRANLALPRFAELRATLFPADLPAKEKFLREEVRLENLMYDLLKVRQILEQSSLAYVLERDPAQLRVAKLALNRLCAYQRWDYFLEGGKQTIGLQRAPEATIACVLALDWLGDELTEAERAGVERCIITLGAPACFTTLYGMKYPDRVRGWTQDPREKMPFVIDMARWPLILNATNLKVIPICGLGFAAIALQGRHPDAGKWLELARQSARAFAIMYGLDGAYDEGPGYWGYTTMHMILFADVLFRKLGIDDRQLINYPGTVRYAISLAMPTAANPKDTVNFSDAGSLDTTVAAWVGLTHGDRVSNHVAANIGGLSHWPAAVWFRPEAPAEAPGADLYDMRLSNDIVISRTGWEAADGVVALRSGGPANHEHADRNSVLFKIYGERLFHDPFGGAYIASVPRWRLRLTEAHSAVLINGQGHQYHDGREGTNSSWANASVTDFRTGPGWMKVTSDATEAYQLVNPDVTQVERTLFYLKPDVLLILDRVKVAKAATVQVRYQVFNDDGGGAVTAADGRFTITRPKAVLGASVQTAGPASVRVGRIELAECTSTYQPAKASVHEFAEIESAAATAHVILTVAAASPVGTTPGTLKITAIEGGWRVEGRHAGRSIRVELVLKDGALPEVRILGA
ncbi:MAG: heparinase II/III family protein [Opitutaceae bacterium]|nr:heparinase II/III family protein [Opitutaceae bacterium]